MLKREKTTVSKGIKKKKGGSFERVNNGDFEMGYGGQSERGYVFIDNYGKQINYLINEQVKRGIPVNLTTPWYINMDVRHVLRAKDPLFNENMALSRAHLNHPLFIEYVQYFLENLMNCIENKDKIFSVCLFNEPTNNSSYTWHQPLWTEYLTELYENDITKLNDCYKTEYTSFEQVKLPAHAANATNIFNDYMRFNNELIADFMKILSDTFRKVAPGVKCDVKIMQNSFKADKRLNYGNDYELWSDYFDINGCDSFSYYGFDSYPILGRMQWLDFMTSNKNVPVYDSEMHIITDGAKNVFNEEIKRYVLTDRWQAIIHKMGATDIWLMDRAVDTFMMQHIFDAPNITLMPEVFTGFGKQQYDSLRLRDQITAIQRKTPEAAVLFSHTAIQKNVRYTEDLHCAYSNLLNNGEKVFIMNETRAENILTNGVKLLVLPGATHLSASTVETIKKFLEQGGTVVMMDGDLLYDEHEYQQNKDTVDYIYKHATIMKAEDGESPEELIARMVKTGIEMRNLAEIKIVFADTGEPVKNFEFEYAEFEGKMILNISNYNWNNNKEVNIYFNGKKLDKVKDLISDKEYGENVLVEPYRPLLLEF